MSNEIWLVQAALDQSDPFNTIAIEKRLRGYGDVVAPDDVIVPIIDAWGFRTLVDEHEASGGLPLRLVVTEMMLLWADKSRGGKTPEPPQGYNKWIPFDAGFEDYEYLRGAEGKVGKGRTPVIFFTSSEKYIIEGLRRAHRYPDIGPSPLDWQHVYKFTAEDQPKPNFDGLRIAVRQALRL